MKSAVDPKLSEAEYLSRKASEAKEAASIALNQAKAALVSKADPRPIARKHPVVAIVIGLVGGMIAALLAIPSKEEQALRRLERLHRATHPNPPAPATPTGNGAADHHAPAEKPSIWSTLLHEVIQMIKPIILATITAGIKSATAPPPAERETDSRNGNR